MNYTSYQGRAIMSLIAGALTAAADENIRVRVSKDDNIVIIGESGHHSRPIDKETVTSYPAFLCEIVVAYADYIKAKEEKETSQALPA